jgi:hypothetical protein
MQSFEGEMATLSTWSRVMNVPTHETLDVSAQI